MRSKAWQDVGKKRGVRPAKPVTKLAWWHRIASRTVDEGPGIMSDLPQAQPTDRFTELAGLAPAALHADFFDNASEAYVVTDLAGRILRSNAAAGPLFGVPTSQLTGRTLMEFVDTSRQQEAHEHLVQVNDRKAAVEWETALKRDEGGSLFVAVRVLPIIDRGGTALALRWLLRDQDAPRRAAEARVLQVERLAAIGQMA